MKPNLISFFFFETSLYYFKKPLLIVFYFTLSWLFYFLFVSFCFPPIAFIRTAYFKVGNQKFLVKAQDEK